MNRYEKITYIIILISLLIFNISFWIDNWSTSENASQGMWDLCFKSDDNGCCQSFPDRGHETPDWFVQFLWALYAAYISIAITCIICPYCVLLNEKNIEGKECMTVLLIASCFSSAICLIMALLLYGFNFKSVESLEDHNLHTSFWLTVVCVVLFSFDGLMMTVITIKNGWCVTRCRNAPKSTSGNIELTNVSFDNANNPIQHDPEDTTHYVTERRCTKNDRQENFTDINYCDVEQRRRWKAERQRCQNEDSTHHDLKEQRQHAEDERWGNYNDINDYNVEERRGWRGWRLGHQKDKTHYDLRKSWRAQDEQQGYYKDINHYGSDVKQPGQAERHGYHEDINHYGSDVKQPGQAERHGYHEDFRRRWTGAQTGKLQIEKIPEHSDEYKMVKESFLTNNSNFKIIEICRVQNKEMYKSHCFFENNNLRDARKKYPGSYRKYLWHGTSADSIENINKDGFNRNYQGKNAVVYGHGTYFARDPSYSSGDTYSVPEDNGDKFVYKCSVLVGEYGKGESDLKDPPFKRIGVRYDSAVDDVNNPTIHVIFRDYQAYPEYLIKFNGRQY